MIGKDGALPWHLPAELAHFEETIRGGVLLSGRKSYETAQGGALSNLGSEVFVLTSQKDYRSGKATVVHGVEEALTAARRRAVKTLFVLGGGEVYRQFLDRADELILTTVHTTVEDGDTFFPEFDPAAFPIYHTKKHEADVEHAFGFTVFYRRAV